jgi:Cu/Ag efflux protein CusF
MSMLATKTINKKKVAVLLTGLFAVVAAALFATSFAQSAYDEGKMISFKGEVTAIDPAAKTFAVRSIESAKSEPAITLKGELTFAMDEGTKVKECDKDMAFSDLKVGDRISVSYHEEEGKSLADSIAIEALGKKC